MKDIYPKPIGQAIAKHGNGHIVKGVGYDLYAIDEEGTCYIIDEDDCFTAVHKSKFEWIEIFYVKEENQKIYISGRMTDDPQHEYKFNAAVEKLMKDYIVVNPVDISIEVDGTINNATYKDYLKADIKKLMGCDAIYMLSGWEQSKGAKAEHSIAVALDMKIIYEASNENN